MQMGIIAITRSGQTAEIVSNAKPFMKPVYAFSNNKKTVSQLSLAAQFRRFWPLCIQITKEYKFYNENFKTGAFSTEDLKFVVISGILSETLRMPLN